MSARLFIILATSFLLASLSSCYRMRASRGGGQISPVATRNIHPDDIALPPGYSITAVATGLTFPSAVTFDDQERAYVVETGYSYGEVWELPRLLRLEPDGRTTVIAKGGKNGPWTSIVYHNGSFYVSEGGEASGGRILRISMDGKITPLLENLPSMGDHHTNALVIKDGYIYFGQGTATNAGVVGTDNAQYGWLPRKKDFHDIPCADVILAGQNYSTENVLTPAAGDQAVTGAYVPFNTPTRAGQVIKGSIPCNGSILKIPLEGGKPELVAWGLRNPFGLALSPDGKIFATENGFDDRGSRPVWGAGDVLWEIKQDQWYGWPDFSAGRPMKDLEEFRVPGKPAVKPLLQQYPGTPPRPAAVFGVHASANGLDFATGDFGFEGEAFVAEFGDMAPSVGKVLRPVGFKVVRVNVQTGVIRDFAANKGKRNGPASWQGSGGLERPISVRFDPSHRNLYIVDFGIVRMSDRGATPEVSTGVIWKISKD